MGIIQTVLGAMIALVASVVVKWCELRSEAEIRNKNQIREDTRALSDMYSSVCELLPSYLVLRQYWSRHILQQVESGDDHAGGPIFILDEEASAKNYHEMHGRVIGLLRRIRIADSRDTAEKTTRELEKLLAHTACDNDEYDSAYGCDQFIRSMPKISELEESLVMEARKLNKQCT